MLSISRTDTSIVGRWWWTVDRLLLSAFLALAFFGILLVATASPAVAERIGLSSFHFVNKHLSFLFLSLSVMIVTSMLPEKIIRRLCLVGFLGSCLAMILVIFIGSEIKGAQRWLDFGFFSIQPSEFMKPCFAVVAAWLLARKLQGFGDRNFHILAVFFVLVITLLLRQPDIGMTVLTTGMIGAEVFMAGFPLFWTLVLAAIGIGGIALAYFVFPHVTSRIDRFLNPASGDTFQIEKSLESFSHGGFFGVGPGEGTIKMLLPDAHADFIFAVSGEEMGLIWTTLLIGLYVFIIWRSITRVLQNKELFNVLAVSGLVSVFAFQAIIHMCSSLHMIPTKGMTLPLASYGGSSMIAMGVLTGLILALTKKQPSFSGIKEMRPLGDANTGSRQIRMSGSVK